MTSPDRSVGAFGGFLVVIATALASSASGQRIVRKLIKEQDQSVAPVSVTLQDQKGRPVVRILTDSTGSFLINTWRAGHFLSEEEVTSRGGARLTDLLTGMPGVRAVALQTCPTVSIVTIGRNAPSLAKRGASPRFPSPTTTAIDGFCPARNYVDGAPSHVDFSQRLDALFQAASLLVLGSLNVTSFASVSSERQFARYPFASGEQSSFRMSWGIFGAGSGTLALTTDTIRGDTVLHGTLTIRGGIPGARVNERLETWMEPESLASLRYLQHTRYPRFSRDRLRDFLPAERRWTGHTNNRPEQGELPTSRPLDEIAFLYVARTLDLEIGREILIQDYWKPEGNPVRLKVLRREVVKVPAGTFNCIVVQPIIKSSGLFGEGGEAEVFFSEGPARELVMLKAKLSIATLTLRLEKFQPGTRK
jgi:hypothetical protein